MFVLYRDMDEPLRATLLEMLERLLSVGDVNRMKFCDRGAVGHILKVRPIRATTPCAGLALTEPGVFLGGLVCVVPT